MNPYAILGIQPGASPEEIRLAYRRLARETHPDLHPEDPTATARFQQLQAAYEMLTAPAPARCPPAQPVYRDCIIIIRFDGNYAYSSSGTSNSTSWWV